VPVRDNSAERAESERSEELAPICTAVEGIAVEFGSPGFRGIEIVAVANAMGPTAPKTNVARSSLESTDERQNLLRSVYKAYVDGLSDEAKGADKYFAIFANGRYYILGSQPVGRFLGEVAKAGDRQQTYVYAVLVLLMARVWNDDSEGLGDTVQKILDGIAERVRSISFDKRDEFLARTLESRFIVFDPFARSGRAVQDVVL
jgi:hypothetical protein